MIKTTLRVRVTLTQVFEVQDLNATQIEDFRDSLRDTVLDLQDEEMFTSDQKWYFTSKAIIGDVIVVEEKDRA